MTVHALAGLPRSGSTLLGNVLAQHPDVTVSGTSPLYACVEGIVNRLTGTAEVAAELANVPGSQERYANAIRAFMREFRPGDEQQVDKSRGWLRHVNLLRRIDPASAVIVCVRDPRDVIASIERRHRATPEFHHPAGATIEEMCTNLLSPRGVVGSPILLVEDMLKRNVPITIVRFESFVAAPEPVLAKVHEALGVEPFEHDLLNVENVAPDLDALYRGKYPHDGSGPVKPPDGDWRDVLSEVVGAKIAAVYPFYMQAFSYT